MHHLDRLQPVALLALRLILGVVMIAHGYSKVFGGMAHHIESVHRLGFPGFMAYLSAGAEFFGGILLILGLITRIAALAIFINMLVAVLGVHLKNGLVGRSGYEFALTLATIAFALIFLGGGPFALDALRGWRPKAKKT